MHPTRYVQVDPALAKVVGPQDTFLISTLKSKIQPHLRPLPAITTEYVLNPLINLVDTAAANPAVGVGAGAGGTNESKLGLMTRVGCKIFDIDVDLKDRFLSSYTKKLNSDMVALEEQIAKEIEPLQRKLNYIARDLNS